MKAKPTGLDAGSLSPPLRERYFGATPVQSVNVELGFFGFERGQSTEITTYDEDSYLYGKRIRILTPGPLSASKRRSTPKVSALDLCNWSPKGMEFFRPALASASIPDELSTKPEEFIK